VGSTYFVSCIMWQIDLNRQFCTPQITLAFNHVVYILKTKQESLQKGFKFAENVHLWSIMIKVKMYLLLLFRIYVVQLHVWYYQRFTPTISIQAKFGQFILIGDITWGLFSFGLDKMLTFYIMFINLHIVNQDWF